MDELIGRFEAKRLAAIAYFQCLPPGRFKDMRKSLDQIILYDELLNELKDLRDAMNELRDLKDAS